MKFKSLKLLAAVLTLVMLLVVTAGCSGKGSGDAKTDTKAGSGTGKDKFYSYVSSNPGGTWYNMVGGAINLYNEKIPGVKFSVEASGGSVENVRRVASGEADFGMAYSSHMYEAWNGKGNFEGKPSQDIRALCEVYRSSHYFVTLKNKNIKSMKDLEGKKVALGAPGSVTTDNSRRVLDALGIKVNGVELSFGDAARALQDGKLDALGQGGAPAAGVVELAASQEIYIIPFSDEELDKIVKLAPYFEKGILPANTYKGQDKDVPTFYFSVYKIANKKVPDDVVYNVLKATFDPEGKKYLSNVHPQWKELKNNPEGLKQLGVPYHPGAEKFWKEQGK
ncbi:MAG: TAXI family TRAP transporter solute-binding subunit [Peptococcaceae bacterium]|nr:TAXI family TRAP transporter solute-binding subunit [Peptococcaceae bacterium]